MTQLSPFCTFSRKYTLSSYLYNSNFQQNGWELFFYLATYALTIGCVGLNPADGKRLALRSVLFPPGALRRELCCKYVVETTCCAVKYWNNALPNSAKEGPQFLLSGEGLMFISPK